MANLPTRNNNPGNIRGADGNFKVMASPLEGQAVLYNDLTAKMTGNSQTGLNGESTLYEFVQKYAPKGDGNNDPVSYTASLANQLGVSPDTKIGTLLPRIDDFARAVATHEGYKGEWVGPSDTKSGLKASSGQDSSKFNEKPYSSGTVDLPKPNNKDIAKNSSKGLWNVSKEVSKGVVKGTGQIYNKAAAPIADKISGLLHLNNKGGEAVDKTFKASNEAQKKGVIVGKDVLPAIAAATTGGAAATAVGIPVAGLISKLLQGTKYGLVYDALANGGSVAKGLFNKAKGLF